VEKIEGQIEKHWDGRDREEVDRRTDIETLGRTRQRRGRDRRTDRETEGRTRHTEETYTEIHG
jgi:hypothetical protein